MALVDELTGAGNQAFLMKNLTAHLLNASTRRGGVCLALVELRELKNITKEHSDSILDEIMISQYRRLRRAVRPTDVVARLDNNSYGIIMHHTSFNDYKPSSIERIITMINNRDYKTTAGNLSISGCIGISYYRGDEYRISAEEMLESAEKKLQQARLDKTLDIAY